MSLSCHYRGNMLVCRQRASHEQLQFMSDGGCGLFSFIQVRRIQRVKAQRPVGLSHITRGRLVSVAPLFRTCPSADSEEPAVNQAGVCVAGDRP
jgi:hypothetical protein